MVPADLRGFPSVPPAGVPGPQPSAPGSVRRGPSRRAQPLQASSFATFPSQGTRPCRQGSLLHTLSQAGLCFREIHPGNPVSSPGCGAHGLLGRRLEQTVMSAGNLGPVLIQVGLCLPSAPAPGFGGQVGRPQRALRKWASGWDGAGQQGMGSKTGAEDEAGAPGGSSSERRMGRGPRGIIPGPACAVSAVVGSRGGN